MRRWRRPAAVALASGVMLLPGHSAPSAAGGCGLVACTSRRVTPATATGESSVSLRGARQAPARTRVAPAQPGGRARATPSLSPGQLAPHHGQANGLTHRRHGRWASTGCGPARCSQPASPPRAHMHVRSPLRRSEARIGERPARSGRLDCVTVRTADLRVVRAVIVRTAALRDHVSTFMSACRDRLKSALQGQVCQFANENRLVLPDTLGTSQGHKEHGFLPGAGSLAGRQPGYGQRGSPAACPRAG